MNSSKFVLNISRKRSTLPNFDFVEFGHFLVFCCPKIRRTGSTMEASPSHVNGAVGKPRIAAFTTDTKIGHESP